jgi:WD40 repeat protein
LATATNGGEMPDEFHPVVRVFDRHGDVVIERDVGLRPRIAWGGDDRLSVCDHEGQLYALNIDHRELIEARQIATAPRPLDGVVVAVNPHLGAYACTGDKRLEIRILDSSELLDTVDFDASKKIDMRWSPNHRYLAVVCVTSGARLGVLVYDAQQRDSHHRVLDNTLGPPSVSWDPTSRELAVGRFDGTVLILDAASLDDRAHLRGSRGPVWAAEWSPDGMRVATGSDDGAVRIWDTSHGDLVATYHVPDRSSVLAVDWSPDGRTLAVGSKNGAIYLLEGEPPP